MARIGLPYTEVERAAKQLLATGQSPSVQRVREMLQTGSNSTIAKHLKTWREKLAEQALPTLPSNVPDTLIPAIDIFWQVAMAQAEQQLLAQKKQLNDQKSAFEQEQLIFTSLHEDMKQRMAKAEHDLNEKKETCHNLNHKLSLVDAALIEQKTSAGKAHHQLSERLNRAYREKDNTLEDIEIISTEKSILQQQLQEQADNNQQALLDEQKRQEEVQARWLMMLDESNAEIKPLRALLKKEQAQRYEESRSYQNSVLTLNTDRAEAQAHLKLIQKQADELAVGLKQSQAENQNLKARILYLEAEIDRNKLTDGGNHKRKKRGC